MTDSELNDAVARKILGFEKEVHESDCYWHIGQYRYYENEYSWATRIEHAFEVVEKMREKGYWLELNDSSGPEYGDWNAAFDDELGNRFDHSAETASKAICLAALSALKALEATG